MSDPLAYRPVSIFAVAGLLGAGTYALWLLSAAGLAWHSGQPLLLNPLILLLPLTASILSGLGWRQVVRSEGTRVGLRLAQGGLTLSLLFGLGYAVYYGSGELARRQQVREFTLRWLEQAGRSRTDEVDAYAAFWNTLDPLYRPHTLDLNLPEARQKLADDPRELAAFKESLRSRYSWGDRGARGALPFFFEHPLILLLQQGGDRVQVEPLGVRDWQYFSGREGGFLLEQSYRLTTPEGVFDVALPVLRKDQRQCQVLLGEAVIRQSRLSAFGQQLQALRADSRRFATDWMTKLAEGKGEEVPVDSSHLVADTKKAIPEIIQEMRDLFAQAAAGKGCPLTVVPYQRYPASRWQLQAGELRLSQPFVGTLAGKYYCTGHLVVVTTDTALLRQLQAAEAAGPQSIEAPYLGRQTSWRLLTLELDSASRFVPDTP